MVDSALVQPAPTSSGMDRLDAAHALLGAAEATLLETVQERVAAPVVTRRPRSGSVGLDELAELAAGMERTENSVSVSSSSSDDDSEAMPPPPPRCGRKRSSSNPEGMEKWGDRRHLLLPSAILEEELAEASALAKAHEESIKHLPIKKRGKALEDDYGTSPNSVTSPIMTKINEESFLEEANVKPEELLRRARSRLLEDLSEGSLKGEKGVLMLPHSLSKYKEVGMAIVCQRTFCLRQQLTFVLVSVYRLTIRMDALVSIRPQNELLLLLGSTASDRGVFGTRKFAMVAERI